MVTQFRTRLNRGHAIGASLQKILKSHSIPISTKIRLMKPLVWPVATYGCESWTLRKNEDARLDAFELKGLRKILWVSWTAKKSNEWVLKFQQSWSKEGTVRHCQCKKASISWSHYEETRAFSGERDNARNNTRCTQVSKTTHGLDGQHQYVDRTICGRVNQNDKGDSTSMVWPTLLLRTAKEENKTLPLSTKFCTLTIKTTNYSLLMVPSRRTTNPKWRTVVILKNRKTQQFDWSAWNLEVWCIFTIQTVSTVKNLNY